RRPADYSRRLAKERRTRFVRKTWRRLALVGLLWAAAGGVQFIWPTPLTPYVVGGLAVGFAWFVHWMLWTGDGGASQRIGSGAKDIERLLADGDVRTHVRPVLVLWGPDVPNFDAGWKSPNGVTVVSGRQAKLWRRRLKDGSFPEADRDAIEIKLNEIVASAPV